MYIWQVDPAQMTTYYNLALCDALAAAGCRVRYVTSRFLYDDALPEHPAFTTDLHYFRSLEWRGLLRYTRLRRALRAISYPVDHLRLYAKIRKCRPDIVHFQWSRLPRFDLCLIRGIQNLDIPVVHTVHDVVPLFSSSISADRHASIYSRVDALIVHTQESQQAMLARYPAIQPERMHVVPLLASKNYAIPTDASRDTARRLLRLPTDAPIFLFFGSVKDYKGLDILARAWQQVQARYSDAILLIAGRPDGPEQLRQLDNLTRQSGVRIHAAFVPYNIVWQYHYAADVIVFPYRSIYQSGALITSLSFGRAVIVTNVGGLPEGVDGNGWIVPPEDPDSLAHAMGEAIADMDQLVVMGQRSLTLVDERFGTEPVARQTLAIYRAVLEANT